MKKVCIGSDHAGFGLKTTIIHWLTEKGYEVKDTGTYSDAAVDYPDFAHRVAMSVSDRAHEIGILVCGSGQGVSITANKYSHIRAALCWTKEIASKAREHNNANVLCLPGQCLGEEEANQIVEAFLSTEFQGGRHLRRIQSIISGLPKSQLIL
jgi:ribose 5-phosphate isomerase B